MTTTDDLDHRADELGTRLAAWMASGAPQREPAGLVAGAVDRTQRVRQRPALLAGVGSRWGRLPVPGLEPPARLALIAMLLVVLAGVAAVVGARMLERPAPNTLPARNDVAPVASVRPDDGTAYAYRERLVHAGTISSASPPVAAASLPRGRVLVLGELEAEVFDPATGKAASAGPGFIASSALRAVSLPDGRVFIVGWAYGPEANTGHAVVQLYDPSSDTFTAGGAMTTSRLEPSVVRLADGRVLISGGAIDESGVPDRTAEIYDPADGTFTRTGGMLRRRFGHSSTLLPDGRVLIVGGDQEGDEAADLYDPATGTFRPAGPRIAGARFRGHTTAPVAPVRLDDGRILVFGVQGAQHCGLHRIEPIGAELFEPASGTFSAAPPIAHDISTATALADGRVLLTGEWQAIPGGCAGGDASVTDAWIGIYDPKTGETRQSLDPITGVSTLGTDTDRAYATALRLADGRVLLVGTGRQSEEYAPPYDLDIFE